jgi:hypothetical protein
MTMAGPSPLARRAALRLFGAAPALAILPMAGSALALASTASPVHPDAALFAMQSAIDAADRELDAAFEVRNRAEDGYFDKRPDRPEQPETILSPEELAAIAALRAASAKRGSSPAWAAYEQAVQEYDLETERLRVDCGLAAAEEMQAAVHKTVNQPQADLIDTPAKTLAGLVFKARYAATHYSDEWDEEVMASILADLLAMADEREGRANV